MATSLSDHNLTVIARKLTKAWFHLKANAKSFRLRIIKSNMDKHDKTIKNINGSPVISGSDVDIETNAVVLVMQTSQSNFSGRVKPKVTGTIHPPMD